MYKLSKKTLLAGALLPLLPLSGSAAVTLFSDNFEDDTIGSAPSVTTPGASWVLSTTGTANPTVAAGNGGQLLDLGRATVNGARNAWADAQFTSTAYNGITVSLTYLVDHTAAGSTSGYITLSGGGTTLLEIDLRRGGNQAVYYNGNIIFDPVNSDTTFHDITLTLGATGFDIAFNGNAATTLSYQGNPVGGTIDKIRFTENADADARVFQIDNLEVSAVTVPEPSSTALIGLAGLGLIVRRRRA